MGMMNNCCYRVKVHPRQTPEGGFALQFEHPTLAGPNVGGWMNRAEDAEKAAAAAVSPGLAACWGLMARGREARRAETCMRHRQAAVWPCLLAPGSLPPFLPPPSTSPPQLAAAPAPAAAGAAANGAAARLFTMEEVEAHDSKESAWFVCDGRVYDATPFLKEHPGGCP